MSHNRNHIIISAIIETGQFSESDVAKLNVIAEKPCDVCSAKDALTVANIVRKKLREPAD